MPHYGGADLPELAAIVEPGPVTQVGTALGDEPVDDLWREQGRHVDGMPDAVSPDSQLTDHAHALAGQYGVARAHLGDRLLHLWVPRMSSKYLDQDFPGMAQQDETGPFQESPGQG